MHAQFLHQLAFAGDAVQIADQQNAQQQLGINRWATGVAVAGSQALAHKLKTDVLIDQPQQMVIGNLIFQTEVVEQRFRAIVLPHHDQQASED
jgi:predicted 2-oxoglutarate/Fe(II)-dependent dioxygenase YbiX